MEKRAPGGLVRSVREARSPVWRSIPGTEGAMLDRFMERGDIVLAAGLTRSGDELWARTRGPWDATLAGPYAAAAQAAMEVAMKAFIGGAVDCVGARAGTFSIAVRVVGEDELLLLVARNTPPEIIMALGGEYHAGLAGSATTSEDPNDPLPSNT
ncbi:MAG: hypothetical protein ACYDDF_09690 [Thermoplasmatota archaeon]